MPYGAPVPQSQATNGLAIAALVLGILSFFCVGLLLGPIAIVLGFLGRKKANDELNGSGAGMALGGIITGVLGFLASAAIVFFFFIAADATVDGINSDPSDGVCDESRWLQDPDC